MKRCLCLIAAICCLVSCDQIKSIFGGGGADASLPGRYPVASERILLEKDLDGLSKADLSIMKNEILARHGFVFSDPSISDYFNSQSWYKGEFSNIDSFLSTIEKRNIEFIQQHEASASTSVRSSAPTRTQTATIRRTASTGINGVAINGNNVRLRTAPSLNAPILTLVSRGTILEYLGESGNFYKVNYNGKTAYVTKDYSYITSEDGGGISHDSYNVVLTSGNVNVRNAPSMSAGIYAATNGKNFHYPKGTRLEYVATVGDFYEVILQDGVTHAYVSSQFSYIE